jgi:glycosyltransferase
MTITVITVVYNGENTIEHTLQSVLMQTVPPDEYLIVDGASMDGTLTIVKNYEEAFAQRGISYRIISERDYGIYDAMNKGVRAASGEFVAMLNSDDWYEPDAIKTVKEEYEKQPFDLGYGSMRYVGKQGKLLVKKSGLDSFVSSRNWNHPTTFVRRDLCIRYPFDLNLKVYADFDWYLKLRTMDLRICIFPTDRVLTNFRAGGASINANLYDMMRRAREKYFAYRRNGYSRIYFLESYLWEFVKYGFAVICA